VPHRQRHHARPVTIDHRQIGVAQTGHPDFHEHFARPWRIELDLLHMHGLALGIGRGQAHLPQHGATHLH